jgi:hypothetical protein
VLAEAGLDSYVEALADDDRPNEAVTRLRCATRSACWIAANRLAGSESLGQSASAKSKWQLPSYRDCLRVAWCGGSDHFGEISADVRGRRSSRRHSFNGPRGKRSAGPNVTLTIKWLRVRS